MSIRIVACMAVASGLVAGCAASMSLFGGGSVSDDKLKERAAFALGTTPNAVTISNRSSEGVRVNFTATVGKRANQCYVTHSVGNTSDAICSGTGSRPGVTRRQGSGGTCNALLRSAGRC